MQQRSPMSGTTRRFFLAMTGSALAASCARGTLQAAGGWSMVDDAAMALVGDGLSPGLVIGAMIDGAMVYGRGFGTASLELPGPVDADSVFRIGSNSKQFTAAAMLALAEEGRLSLNDRLSRFIPEFPRADEISIYEMLTHTAGIGNYTDRPREEMMEASRPDYDQAALLTEMIATDPPYVFEPGTGWAYSNTAYALLGIVIERVTDAPYGVYVRERIAERAGLEQTVVDDVSDVVPGRVSGYTPAPDRPTGFANAPYISMTFPGAGGAMRSTATELCKWHAALLGGDVLSTRSLETMLRPARLRNGALPRRPGRDGGEGSEIRYGLGVGVGAADGRDFVSHTGGIHGFNSMLRSYPAERLTIALLANCDGGEDRGSLLGAMNDILGLATSAALGS